MEYKRFLETSSDACFVLSDWKQMKHARFSTKELKWPHKIVWYYFRPTRKLSSKIQNFRHPLSYCQFKQYQRCIQFKYENLLSSWFWSPLHCAKGREIMWDSLQFDCVNLEIKIIATKKTHSLKSTSMMNIFDNGLTM